MTKTDIYLSAIETAKQELRQAEQNLQYAEPEFITAAVLDLAAKREKLNVLLRMAKKEAVASGQAIPRQWDVLYYGRS